VCSQNYYFRKELFGKITKEIRRKNNQKYVYNNVSSYYVFLLILITTMTKE